MSHNISFLNAVISKQRFRDGRLSTGFIAEEYPNGFHAADVPHEDPSLLIAIAASIHRRYMDRAAQLSGQLPSHERRVGDDFVVIVDRVHHPVHVLPAEGGFEVRIGGDEYTGHHGLAAWASRCSRPRSTAIACACRWTASALRYRLFHRGSQMDAMVVTPTTASMERLMLEKQPPDLSKFLLSPMPGLLKRLAVKVGDEIKAGEELAVVEAMKMENSLRATDDVTISKILATEGQSLDGGPAHPRVRMSEPPTLIPPTLAAQVRAGDRRALARAITLVESATPEDQAAANRVLEILTPHAGKSIRIGVTGVPGVGKSTFIEALGNHVVDQGHRVAVLAVDPSSAISGGSILGDKTRMETLGRRPEAYIRPSPAGRTLGGVTRHTRETLLRRRSGRLRRRARGNRRRGPVRNRRRRHDRHVHPADAARRRRRTAGHQARHHGAR